MLYGASLAIGVPENEIIKTMTEVRLLALTASKIFEAYASILEQPLFCKGDARAP